MPRNPRACRSVAVAALLFLTRGTLKQWAHLDLISTFHPPSGSICNLDRRHFGFNPESRHRGRIQLILSNVYRKLSKAEVRLHLRIADRSEIAPRSVGGLRSASRPFLAMRHRFCRPTSVRQPSLSIALVWAVFFTLAIACSWATGQSVPPAETAQSSAWDLAKSDPHALVQAAIVNELKNSYGHRPPARYLLRKKTRNTDTTKEIVETSQSGVARLVAIHDKPLNAAQTQTELQRLQELASDPAAQQHRHHNEERDAARITSVMRLLPEAFINHFEGAVDTPNGAAIRMTFEPNPHFAPPTLESRILTGIHGEIWIDPTDLRVVRIEGHLFRQVDYGWGILGTLYPGGTIRIEQLKTQECGWQLSHLTLNMTGKELMLKSLRVVVDETASDYRPVPPGWRYTDAIHWLLHMPEISPTIADQP
jgi:hypothetical protein